MIYIAIPATYQPERHYILSVIFENFLGLDIEIHCSDRQDTRIHIDHECELVIADGLFPTLPDQWLQPTSLPKQPLPIWNFTTTGLSATTLSSEIPVIYGHDPKSSNFFQCSDNKIYLGLDIFGSAFFMLTRYEEIVKTERDEHDRFPAAASLAYQENFLHRPIINEYVEILWACLKKLWPNLERKQRNFSIYMSCDVDRPFDVLRHKLLIASRRAAGDIVKRRSLALCLDTYKNYLKVKLNGVKSDPFWTFDWMMDTCEQENITISFYFITGAQAKYDNYSYWIEPRIKKLIQDICVRGHRIGLHGSYTSYNNADKLLKEFVRFKQVANHLNINQEKWGGRQHYLRWQAPVTWRNWEKVGLDYDSTLSFAEIPGFRCGICYPYPVFDLQYRQTYNLIESPLIAMEASLLAKKYQNLTYDIALQNLLDLKRICKTFNGQFSLLWHNSSFNYPEEYSTFTSILSTS